ncbi:STAS domain-containing protein [Microbacterium thalli]|uniref:Anti-sigma factor antagonist n=1 Tax=Microbacterium thalli TaxID=3027921 RepID=A0ABT5SIT2_9MICO|nr:STAS domain-containing protein [Microbacterium thalli]MDD7929871.1 STAS domain-containing protein [Microbacterium thalli]MDD7962631.1 STAS domain-containing protein [Microbacterium thalli]MDN8549810.1 STAS domain-containing protein [Microbacterium thalli]
MIDLDIDVRDNGRVVRPHGRLTMVSAREFRERVNEEISAAPDALVVVDLSDLQFIDSSGLGALVACLKSARQAGGDLRLAAPTEQITMVLGLTNLDRVLRPRATVEEALVD